MENVGQTLTIIKRHEYEMFDLLCLKCGKIKYAYIILNILSQILNES
jgi:hypothetical protein